MTSVDFCCDGFSLVSNFARASVNPRRLRLRRCERSCGPRSCDVSRSRRPRSEKQMYDEDTSANGTSASVGRSSWMRPARGGADGFPSRARGRIFLVGADRVPVRCHGGFGASRPAPLHGRLRRRPAQSVKNRSLTGRVGSVATADRGAPEPGLTRTPPFRRVVNHHMHVKSAVHRPVLRAEVRGRLPSDPSKSGGGL